MAKADPMRPIRLTLLFGKEPGLKYTRLLNKNTKHGRSAVRIQEKKNTLLIEIKANDPTALRASINSVLRDLQVIEATKL